MIDWSPPGQDAARAHLAALDDAAARLRATHRVEARALVDDYRALAPRGHPRAASPVVDLGFVLGAHALGGAALVGAGRLVVEEHALPLPPSVRADALGVTLAVEASRAAPADGLALAAGLLVERAKVRAPLGDVPSRDPVVLARLLGLGDDELAASGAPLAVVVDALAALAAGPDTLAVHLVTSGAARPAASVAVDDGPLFLCAGATARLHELLAPLPRRVAGELARLVGDDDADAALDVLPAVWAHDPATYAERLVVEHDDGLTPTPYGVAVSARALDPALVDARVRDAVSRLAALRATILIVGRAEDALRAALVDGGDARAAILFDEGLVTGPTPFAPDVIVGPRAILDVDNALSVGDGALRVLQHVPSLGLAPSRGAWPGASASALAAPLVDELARARALGALAAEARVAVGVAAPDDGRGQTALALAVLGKMAASSARPRTRATR